MQTRLALIGMAFLAFSGCAGTIATTIPSPVSEAAAGNFQLRLHSTGADGAQDLSAGYPPFGRGSAEAAGAARGCTLTGISPENIPANMNYVLSAAGGECRVWSDGAAKP